MYDPGGGSRIGDSALDDAIARGQAAAQAIVAGPGDEDVSPFDKYRTYFSDPYRASFDQTFLERGLPSGLREVAPPSPEERRKRREAGRKEHERQREERLNRLIELTKQAGLIGDDFLPSELDHIWQEAVNTAEASSTFGETVTPWNVLEHWAKDKRRAREFVEPGPSAPDLEDIEDLPPEKRTIIRTHKSFEVTDPHTARAVVVAGLRDRLGRTPRKAEIRQFREYLAELERNNPVVTRTTSEYVDGELADSESEELEGGAPTPSAAFENFAEDEFADEAFAYSIAQSGTDLLREIVGPIV